MSSPWSTEVIRTAVRESLGRSSMVNRGFQLDAVWPEDGELVVAFRWWRDPNRYAVRFGLPRGALPESPWTGLQTDSAQEWAREVAGLLTEELETGAVRRARRRREDGVVELDLNVDSPTSCPPGYYSSAVLLPRSPHWWAPGRWAPGWWGPTVGPRADFGRTLAAVGLDVRTPRQQYRRGRLLSWCQLSTDTTAPEPVGHVSAAWHPTLSGVGTLDVLRLLPGVPESAAPYLARMAVHDAAEAGARQIRASCAHPGLARTGFHREHEDDPFTLDTTELD